MAGRYERLDSDESRLPDGMTRVGYDADTQRYTFRDADGSLWESAEGSQYGTLHRAGEAPRPHQAPDAAWQGSQLKAQNRAAWRYLLPFLVLVGLFLLLVFRVTRGTPFAGQPQADCEPGSVSYRVVRGDTCWDLAEKFGTKVGRLEGQNPGLDCSALVPGKPICVPQEGDAMDTPPA